MLIRHENRHLSEVFLSWACCCKTVKTVKEVLCRFYMALENSVCRDYVTEKFWDRLNDWVVPIVLNDEVRCCVTSFIHGSM